MSGLGLLTLRFVAGLGLVHDDGGTTDAHHEHAPALAHHLIVEVDSDDGVRADLLSLLSQLL